MPSLGTYQGGLTAEQFLFSEIRIVSQMYLDGVSTEEIVQRGGKPLSISNRTGNWKNGAGLL